MPNLFSILQKCYFCIGHELPLALTSKSLRRFPPLNLDLFLERMRQSGTRKVIFTGTSTDPQLYKYEAELLALVRAELPGVHISLHSNGMLADRKMDIFNSYDSTLGID